MILLILSNVLMFFCWLYRWMQAKGLEKENAGLIEERDRLYHANYHQRLRLEMLYEQAPVERIIPVVEERPGKHTLNDFGF